MVENIAAFTEPGFFKKGQGITSVWIVILDTPCAAGARSTSFHPAVDLNQRYISYVVARHFQNCPISASTRV